MALNNKRVSITAETLQDSTRIANYSAILDVASKKITLTVTHSDDVYKETTRADQEEFETYAYAVLDQITSEA